MNACYVVVPGQPKGERIGIVKLNESGYYLTDYDTHDTEEQCKEHVRYINDQRGISKEIEQSMLEGSMFGWKCPAARPALDYFAEQSSEME
jgi:hypothetical protein